MDGSEVRGGGRIVLLNLSTELSQHCCYNEIHLGLETPEFDWDDANRDHLALRCHPEVQQAILDSHAVLVEIHPMTKKNALLLAAEFWRSSLPSTGKLFGRSPHTPLQHACRNSI